MEIGSETRFNRFGIFTGAICGISIIIFCSACQWLEKKEGSVDATTKEAVTNEEQAKETYTVRLLDIVGGDGSMKRQGLDFSGNIVGMLNVESWPTRYTKSNYMVTLLLESKGKKYAKLIGYQSILLFQLENEDLKFGDEIQIAIEGLSPMYITEISRIK